MAELTCLAGSSCTGIQTSSGTGFLAENSISNFEHLCALVVPALADTFAPYQQKFHKELLEQLARHREEGWYETGLFSNWYRPLLPIDKKVLCIDFTFTFPHYASWKSYEDAMKSSLISLRKAWLNPQLTRGVPHALSSCHQGNCTVYKDACNLRLLYAGRRAYSELLSGAWTPLPG